MLPFVSMFHFLSTQMTPRRGESYSEGESLTPSFPVPILIVSDGNGYPIKDTLVKSGDIDKNERELKVYSRQKKGPSNVVSQEPCPSSGNNFGPPSSKVFDIDVDLPIVR